MAYDSEQVDETLWNELISLNPELAEEDKKIISLKEYLKAKAENKTPKGAKLP